MLKHGSKHVYVLCACIAALCLNIASEEVREGGGDENRALLRKPQTKTIANIGFNRGLVRIDTV